MEKVRYENETNLNQEQLIDLLAQQTLPLSKLMMYMSSILILILILILNWDSSNQALYIILSSLLGVSLILVILLLIFKKKLIKVTNTSLANGVTYKYVFYENEFIIDSIVNEKTSHTVMQYKGLEKIVIKGDYAFIYLNSVSIYFVDLNCFTDGKEEVIKIFSQYKKKKSKR